MKKKLIIMALILMSVLVCGIKTPTINVFAETFIVPRNNATWDYMAVYNKRNSANTLISQLATGTKSDPYLINNVEDLICFNYECRINGTLNASNKHVKLMVSIDLGDYYWLPIGQGSSNPVFLLNFDGNNKKIQNMFVNQPGESDNGFIKFLQGSVSNLVFENCHVIGNDSSGILAGSIRGDVNGQTISNITIKNSSVTASDSTAPLNGGCFGGLAGNYYDVNLGGMGATQTSLRISNSYVVNTTVTGKFHVGGFIGFVSNRSKDSNYFEMSGCSTREGTIVNGEKFVGGMIGSIRILGKNAEGTLTQFTGNQQITLCTNEATINASDGYAGGIIGAAGDLSFHMLTVSSTESAKLIVDQCYNTGRIIAGTSGYAAGVVGYLGGTEGTIAGGSTNGIYDCYNLGTITVNSDTIGTVAAGIANRNNVMIAMKGTFAIQNCYQAGTIVKNSNVVFYPITNVNRAGANKDYVNCGANLDLLNNEYDADSASSLTARSQATMTRDSQTIFTIDQNSNWQVTNGYPILKNNKSLVEKVLINYVSSTTGSISGDTAYPGQIYASLYDDKFKHSNNYPAGTYKLYFDNTYLNEVDGNAYITSTHEQMAGYSVIYVLRAVQVTVFGKTYSNTCTLYKFTNEMLTLDDFKNAPELARACYTIVGISNGTLPCALTAPLTCYAAYQQNIWTLTTTGYGTNEAKYQIGAGNVITTKELPNISRPGYDFNGWYTMLGTQEIKIAVGSERMPDNDITVYSKFTARTDTEYRIIDYKQNVNDDGYTPNEPTVLRGTTDTIISAQPIPIVGFVALPYEEVTIKGDGTAVIEFYYDRIKSDLTFNSMNGENNVVINDVKYGKDVTSYMFTPVKAGFTFNGWWRSFDKGQTFNSTMNDIMPYNDETVYAKWEPRVIQGIALKAGYPTTYEIFGTLSSMVKVVATFDNGEIEEVSVTSEMITGFDTSTIGLNKNATITYLAVNTTYTYNVMSYRSVTYQKSANVTGDLPDNQPTVIYGTSIILPSGDNLTRFGYRFYDWFDGTNNYNAGDEYIVYDNVVFIANMITKQSTITFEPNNGEASYTRKASYSVGMPFIILPTKEHYNFIGYFLSDNTTQYYNNNGVGIKDWDRDEDTITLYAKWEPKTYQINYTGIENVTNASSLPTTHIYGTSTVIPNPVKVNASFNGWRVNGGNLVTSLTLDGTAYTNNITIEASFTQTNGSYKVIHHQQNIENDQYTKFEEEVLNGQIGTNTQAIAKIYDGFTALAITQVQIVEGNTAVVEVYYNRNINQVNFKESSSATQYFATLNVKFGAPIPEPSNIPTKTGSNFISWDKGNYSTMPNTTINVVATWELKQTVITFDPNGGNMTILNKTINYGDMVTVETPIWPDDSKKFAGWKYNGDYYPALLRWYYEVDNATFVATWEDVVKYKITFAGGTGAQGTDPILPDTLPGETIKLPMNPYTKDGYRFVGWLTDSNPSSYEEGYPFFQMPKKDVHFEAVWKINQYTYTFYGYDKTIMKQETVDYGAVIVAPNTYPSKAPDATYNYIFEKWNGFTQNMTIGSKNVEFNPIFKNEYVEYTVKFIDNVGTIYKDTVYHYQDEIIPPADPVKIGYTFKGWTGHEKMVTKSVDIIASFEANKTTIKLNPNGGTVSPTEVIIEYDATYQLPIPTSTYPFVGWEYNGVLLTMTKWKILENNVVLTARWQLPSEVYSNIEYVLNSGTLPNSVVNKYLEGEETMLPVPTREGYTFNGWYKDANFGGNVYEKVLSTDTGTQTFYAKWTANVVLKYEVVFVSDLHATGNVPVIENQAVTAIIVIPNSNLTRTGYRFVGWNDGTQTYIGGANYIMGSAKVTFTAVWEVNQYTYKFYAEDGKTIISQKTVAFGTKITKPETPTKASDDTYNYTFKEWRNYQEDMKMPDYDLNFIAEFTAEKKASSSGCGDCNSNAMTYITSLISMASLLAFVLRKKH